MSRADLTLWQRTCRLWGALSCWLAGIVALLFPASHSAGTETLSGRVTLAVALFVAGVSVRATAVREEEALVEKHMAPTFGGPGGILHWLFRAVGTVTMRFGTRVAAGLGVVAWAIAALAFVAAALATRAFWLFGFVATLPACAGICALFARSAHAGEDAEAGTDIVESIATAFILALVVREFAFEAFKIPTGSMEPTICGDYEGLRRRDRMLEDKPWLLNLVQKMKIFPAGDRLLAAKAPLLLGEPHRWSIVVFKYPLFRQTNFIKRLIGLPGEHVEIKGGDIYIDGKVAAKPDEVQETLWFPMLPDASGEWRGDGVASEFTQDGGKWTLTQDGAEGSAEGGKPGYIVHDAGLADVRVSFDLDASKLGGGAAIVRLDGGGRRLELQATADALWLSGPGIGGADAPAQLMKLDAPGVGTGTKRLGFAVADRVARVWLDGRMVARVETADRTNIEGMGDHVAVGVVGGAMKIAKLKLERDLQYSPAAGDMPADWHVPQGCCFMLGDNTNASRDSRAWKGRVFKLKSGGEIVADEAQVRLDDDTQIPSVRDEGDAFEVLDSYGVQRRIKKTDVEGGAYRTEPRPFVNREDLVGRAFFVFFPFPPFGEWRPRILP